MSLPGACQELANEFMLAGHRQLVTHHGHGGDMPLAILDLKHKDDIF